MHQSDTQDAALLLYPEALREIQGIEIAVPSEDSAFAEKSRNFRWMVAAEAER